MLRTSKLGDYTLFGSATGNSGIHANLSDAYPRGSEGVVITPMQREEIPQVSKLHRDAFNGYMNTRLGDPYTKAFLRWFLIAEERIALVARDAQGNIVGYVLGAPIDYGPSMNHDLLCIAAVSVLMRPWLFFRKTFWTIIVARIRSILGVAPTAEPEFRYPEPAMSLIAIGVARSARGKKVGVRLLRAFDDKARELGMRSLQLTVYPDNVIARKLYEANGWMSRQSANQAHAIEYFRVLSPEGVEQRLGSPGHH